MAVKLGQGDDAPILIGGDNLRLNHEMHSLCEDGSSEDLLTLPLTAFLTLRPLAAGCGTSLVLGGQAAAGDRYLETTAVRSKTIVRSVIHEVLGRDGGVNSRLATRVAFGGTQGVKDLRGILTERFRQRLVTECEIVAKCSWHGSEQLTVAVTLLKFGVEKDRIFFGIPYESVLPVIADRRRK